MLRNQKFAIDFKNLIINFSQTMQIDKRTSFKYKCYKLVMTTYARVITAAT